jgi:hypothetical protein
VQGAKRQLSPVSVLPIPVPLAEGSVTLAMIEALIPLGLRAVEDALQQEVRALAGVLVGALCAFSGRFRCSARSPVPSARPTPSPCGRRRRWGGETCARAW